MYKRLLILEQLYIFFFNFFILDMFTLVYNDFRDKLQKIKLFNKYKTLLKSCKRINVINYQNIILTIYMLSLMNYL